MRYTDYVGSLNREDVFAYNSERDYVLDYNSGEKKESFYGLINKKKLCKGTFQVGEVDKNGRVTWYSESNKVFLKEFDKVEMENCRASKAKVKDSKPMKVLELNMESPIAVEGCSDLISIEDIIKEIKTLKIGIE